MWCSNDQIAQATGVLPAEVWYLDVRTQQTLSDDGEASMRSAYAHDIFRQEFLSIYEKATEQRNQLKEQAEKSLLFLLQQMQELVRFWVMHTE